jgi:hypothetical protein
MREKADTEKNSAAGVAASVPWRVTDVEVCSQYRLRVRFSDGTARQVDLSRVIRRDDAGVFEALRDPELFARARVEGGAVTWPGEIDLAPDAMYDEIRVHGTWSPS